MMPKVMQQPNQVGTAYILWLGCLFQLHGLQRLYNGKIATGLLWLFTFGLFGFGQFADLFLIPRLVDDHNAKLRALQRQAIGNGSFNLVSVERLVDQRGAISPEFAAHQLTVQLLTAAAARQGKLSVTQGVMATGASFQDVEAALLSIVKTGYADITNHPDTGVVIYEFREL